MANSEVILRRILGPIRSDIRPLALAVDITEGLIFQKNIAVDDIKVTKHVYPLVAKRLRQSTAAVTKSVERLTHICWDSLVEQDLTTYYLGRPVTQPPTPREMLTFLAVYSALSTPFFAAIEQNPKLLFQEPGQTAEAPDASYQFLADIIQKSVPAPVTMALARQFTSGYITFPVCPSCGTTLVREHQNYCDQCGQRLDWNQYEHSLIVFPGQYSDISP